MIAKTAGVVDRFWQEAVRQNCTFKSIISLFRFWGGCFVLFCFLRLRVLHLHRVQGEKNTNKLKSYSKRGEGQLPHMQHLSASRFCSNTLSCSPGFFNVPTHLPAVTAAPAGFGKSSTDSSLGSAEHHPGIRKGFPENPSAREIWAAKGTL